MAEGNTIFALSSGAGLAAVAVIRVSGPAAREVTSALAGTVPQPRVATLRRLRAPASGDEIDDAIVIWMPGPGTFTGEDCAELHVHGSRAVVAKVLHELALLHDCRLAEPGAFTRRAFENGKVDLMSVEGLADLIAAETEEQRKQAWFHKTGGAGRTFREWREGLVAILANFEAAIDFSDEDGVQEAALAAIFDKLGAMRQRLGGELSPERAGESIRDGVRVVLAGAPNVGKSSLLNLLAKRDAAIVSPIKGTTRDAIEVRLDLGGVPVVLVDTAGLNTATKDEIELLGMAKSSSEIEGADLLVWVHAPDIETFADLPEVDSDTLLILNKIDVCRDTALVQGFDVEISAKTGEGVESFMKVLKQRVSAAFVRQEPALVTRERHRQALAGCVRHIDCILARPDAEIELHAESLRLAVRELERLIGKVDVEDLLDVVFRDFCIGK